MASRLLTGCTANVDACSRRIEQGEALRDMVLLIGDRPQLVVTNAFLPMSVAAAQPVEGATPPTVFTRCYQGSPLSNGGSSPKNAQNARKIDDFMV